MAGFQNTLQGGSPTTSSAPKISDNSGINAAASLVGTAGALIGSSYAQSQAQASYENAFQQYRKGSSALGTLEAKLRDVTSQAAEAPSRELNLQMSQLEDIIRKTKLGETSGVLSGLSVKSRIDSAYKTAISKFPAFASELRAHRDQFTSGGAVGAAIEKSKMDSELAAKDAEDLRGQMRDVGLSYDNENDRISFQAYSKELGDSQMQYDMWLAKTSIGRKKMSDASTYQSYQNAANSESRAQEKYEYEVGQRAIKEARQKVTEANAALDAYMKQVKFDHYLEEHPGDVAAKKAQRKRAAAAHKMATEKHEQSTTKFNQEQAQLPQKLSDEQADRIEKLKAAARAAEAHQVAMEKANYGISQRGTQQAQAQATLANTQARTAGQVASNAYNKVAQPISLAAKKLQHDQNMNAYKVQKVVSKHGDVNYRADFARVTQAMQDGKTPEEVKQMVEALRLKQKSSITSMFSQHDMMGTSEYNTYMTGVDKSYDSLLDIVDSGDPVKAKQRQLTLAKIEEDFAFIGHPNYRNARILRHTGKLAALSTYHKWFSENQALPEGSIARQQGDKALGIYAELSGLTPEQVVRELSDTVDSGKATRPVIGALLATGVKQGAYDTAVPEDRDVWNIAMNDTRWGLSALATKKGIEGARKDPVAKEMYGRAFDQHVEQTSGMLPDGWSLDYSNGKWSVNKKDSEGGKESIVFLPNGDTANPTPGFSGWPKGFETVGRDDLVARTKLLAWITANGRGLVPDTLTKDNGGRQNENWIGISGDIAGAVGTGIARGTDVMTSSPAKAYTDQFTSGGGTAQSGSGFLGYTGPKDSAYIDAWESRGKEYLPIYEEAGKAYGVDVGILIRQGAQESMFKNEAASEKGAVGIAQFIPATAKAYGLIDEDGTDHRTDVGKSIDAQARLMADLLERNDGDMATALVEYNGGWKMRDAWKAGKIKLEGSNYKETRGYILSILGESAFKR